MFLYEKEKIITIPAFKEYQKLSTLSKWKKTVGSNQIQIVYISVVWHSDSRQLSSWLPVRRKLQHHCFISTLLSLFLYLNHFRQHVNILEYCQPEMWNSFDIFCKKQNEIKHQIFSMTSWIHTGKKKSF